MNFVQSSTRNNDELAINANDMKLMCLKTIHFFLIPIEVQVQLPVDVQQKEKI